jgi:hypothetical protein
MKRVSWLYMNPCVPRTKRMNLDGYTIVARVAGAEVPELRATIAEATSANATAAMALAVLAVGGLTVGFFVIGRLIIREMLVKKVHLRHLKIDQLDVITSKSTGLPWARSASAICADADGGYSQSELNAISSVRAAMPSRALVSEPAPYCRARSK